MLLFEVNNMNQSDSTVKLTYYAMKSLALYIFYLF